MRMTERLQTIFSAPLVRTVILLVSLCVLGCLQLQGAAGQGSPYVPNLDPAYVELDALIAAGLVEEVHMGRRPYSRLAFAQMFKEAQATAEGEEAADLPQRVWEALGRLEEMFAPEVARLDYGEDRVGGTVNLIYREATADFTWADSPWRGIPTRLVTTIPNIDGQLNPLLTNRQGRSLVDGWTQGLEAGFELQLGSWMSGYIRPRVWASGAREGDTEQDIGLYEGYLRGVYRNVSIEAGRNHLYLGQGLSSAAMSSHNPPGYDMIRVSNDTPFRLPWFLKYLGPTSFTAMVADMGGDRVIPHSKLFLWKGSISPHRNLELGATLLNQQLGEGAPEGSVGERLKDIFLPGIFEQYTFSEKIMGVDARLRFPGQGVELYFDGATTDINLHRTGEMLWDEASWVWGGIFSGLGAEGRGSLRLEAHRVGVRPYTHPDFPSGMTLDGLVMGNPLGPMASGFSARFLWAGMANTIAITGARDLLSGDIYQHNGLEAADFRLVLIEDNPDEIRWRGMVEWSRSRIGRGLRPSVQLGYERVTLFDFTDEDRSNLMVNFTLSYRW